MANREEFCNAVTDIWKNHGIYLWGGNGEYTEKQTIKHIRSAETSGTNAARVFKYIGECYAQDFDMSKSRMCDCSGMVIAALRDIKAISSTTDYRAKDLQKLCKAVKLKNLKAGDLVFNAVNDASHVGVYMGFDMCIEMQGRDAGCTKRKVSEGPWKIGGQLPYFK